MSSEALELSRKAWIAVDSRDLDGFLSLAHEDVDFVSLVAEAEGGPFKWHERVTIWWKSVGESLGTLRYEPQEMRELVKGV